MVPVMSAYIAFSMADRAGLAAGFVGGIIANNIGHQVFLAGSYREFSQELLFIT